jgi:transcription-repair coupling factor (superfamily II helicase)
VHARAAGLPWWTFTSLTRDADLVDDLDVASGSDAQVVTLGVREVAGYRGETDKALDDLRRMVAGGWSVVATTEGHGPAKRMVEVLSGADVPARFDADLAAARLAENLRTTERLLAATYEKA